MRMEHRTPCRHIFCPTPSAPGVGSKGQNVFLLKVVLLYIKLNGMKHHASSYFVLTHTLNLWVALKDKTKKNSVCGHVAYQIKEKEILVETNL